MKIKEINKIETKKKHGKNLFLKKYPPGKL